ncbi:hypothetical protein K505DRAFT_323699 [Melanomma pulvis-pyrius CBS 109.77]|uniref:Uncharacterized protein n=1 Tax=Melanomma pulvis-pyrius CBS 109.77 TaxID=1314802 RepID=A0A6A6XJ26_9PLEO|nr:hypothetical protein K505DRAFT_323699 [Melanomma pulvis-pyrius CBS 109.77]
MAMSYGCVYCVGELVLLASAAWRGALALFQNLGLLSYIGKGEEEEGKGGVRVFLRWTIRVT